MSQWKNEATKPRLSKLAIRALRDLHMDAFFEIGGVPLKDAE